MKWFVLVYDRSTQALIEQRVYSDAEQARAWRDRERLTAAHIGDPKVEVVLLMARSEEDLRATHGRYFVGEAPA